MSLPRAVTSVLEISRHEFSSILRTKRAMTIAGFYLGFALVGGFVYVMLVRAVESKLLEQLMQGSDAMSAAAQLELMSSPAYRQLAAFFAGVESDAMAASLRDSIILPVFLWSSFLFLPSLIVLTSFDQTASELEARSLCYSVLRVPRHVLLLGKALSYGILFVILNAVGSAALVGVASGLLEQVVFTESFWGLFRVWLLLVPFGLCYVGVTSFASVVARTPFGALMIGIGITVALGVLGWLTLIPEDSSWAFLRLLSYLSPGHYQEGLWLSGFVQPLLSTLAFTAFSVVFLALAIFGLERRDL